MAKVIHITAAVGDDDAITLYVDSKSIHMQVAGSLPGTALVQLDGTVRRVNGADDLVALIAGELRKLVPHA